MGKPLNMRIGMIIPSKLLHLLNVFYSLSKIAWCVAEYGYHELVASVVAHSGNGGSAGGASASEMNIFARIARIVRVYCSSIFFAVVLHFFWLAMFQNFGRRIGNSMF